MLQLNLSSILVYRYFTLGILEYSELNKNVKKINKKEVVTKSQKLKNMEDFRRAMAKGQIRIQQLKTK